MIYECTPSISARTGIKVILEFIGIVYIPYLPSLKNPGWLTKYIFGPYDREYFHVLFADIIAGIVLGLIIIPQALAYSLLAGLPPINGLYASILSILVYMFLGTSMQLSIGPATLVSLLTSQIIAKHSQDTSDPKELMDIAAQACLCCGIILIVLSMLHMGNLMSLISHPVLSGFTTGAAFLSGIAQMPSIYVFRKEIFFDQYQN